MIHRSLALLILLVGAATIAQSTLIPFARAAFWRSTRIMPPATRLRRRRLSSLSPDAITSVFLSKESNSNIGSNKKPKQPESPAVVPPTTASSSFVTSTTIPPTTTTTATTTDDPHHYRTLLRSWANHSHADYHNFTEEEADGIRSALLEWYTKHRRKLPWRGDPPPFDGSTSGINNKSKKRTNAAMEKSKANDIGDDQKSITSFFSATPSSRTKGKTGKDKIADSKEIKSEQKPIKGEESIQSSEPLLENAISVTGYGVWVSEIMLQQTRVEAVIPFWIKCK